MSLNNSKELYRQLFRERNFRWFVGGGIISMLGDQFTLIGLPWLALKMTNDTFVVATVMGLLSIPRALFILVGGAITDQYSSKTVLMVTKFVHTFLLGTLSLLVFTGNLNLWLLYVLTFAIGFATAFSYPSGGAVLPQAVRPELIQVANSMAHSLRQFTTFVGPILAGIVIAFFSKDGQDASSDRIGVTIVFLFDAFSFALSAWTLSYVVLPVVQRSTAPEGKRIQIMRMVSEGVRYCWRDFDLKACFLYWVVIAFFIVGPIQIAMPVLALQLGKGVAAFGALAGAQGAGYLIGMILSGIRPNLRFVNLGTTLLLLDFLNGALFICVGYVREIWLVMMLLAMSGALSGYKLITFDAWIQRRTPIAMIGRVLSIFLFIFMGIAPVSAAVAGWILRSVTPTQLFIGCGFFLWIVVGLAFFMSQIRHVTDANRVPQSDAGVL